MNRYNVVKYLAIGDSLTSGVGSLWYPDFVQIYAYKTEFALKTKVMERKAYKNGGTTGDILRIVSKRRIQNFIKQASIITISCGGNDIRHAGKEYLKTGDIGLLYTSLIEAKENMFQIVRIIETINPNVLLRIVNVYNPAPELYEIDHWINDYNMFLLHFQKMNERIRIADVYSAFLGRFNQVLFVDYTHPNSNVYRIIAEELYEAGYYPLKE